MMIFSCIPMQVFAHSGNTAPYLAEEYAAGGDRVTITLGKSYVVNLSEVFADDENDSLTYYAAVNDGEYSKVEEKCIYMPETAGVHTIVFKADDGQVQIQSGTSYTVTITAREDFETRMMQLFTTDNAHPLQSLIIHTGISPKDDNVLIKNQADSYTNGQIFDSNVKKYTLKGKIYDTDTRLGFRALAADSQHISTLIYDGGSSEITWTNGLSKWVDFLTAGKNQFTILVSDKENTKAGTAYSFTLNVIPTISSLQVDDGMYWDKEFDPMQTEYTLTIPKDTKTINFKATATSEDAKITCNGKKSSKVNVAKADKVKIVVKKDGVSNTYTINLEKKKSTTFEIVPTPSDAAVVVTDHIGNKIKADEDGVYTALLGEYQYSYTVAKNGYITKTGTIPQDGGTITVKLKKVKGTQPQAVDSQWYNFRNSDTNMAITSVKTPTNADAENVTAKWIKEFDNTYPSVQIIVDNALVVMADKTLYKIDLENGQVIAQAEMTAAPNFGYTPMTYADGMIFCPLTNGTIQAFNADTLESLWIFQDQLGGQSPSPLAYSDGCLYTGFWRQETGVANFVCITTADEDTSKPDEAKTAVWTHSQQGGFYWAGSVVVGDAVIVGTDDGTDGTSGDSTLYSFDKHNGNVISAITLKNAGDQRSSIAYSEEEGKIYFTSKGGYLCSAKIDTQTGKLSGFKKTALNMESTSTPVVYKNRVYIGAGANFTNGCLVVADADTLDILFTKKMTGYPQGSVLLSNAYEKDTGYIYLYLTYNTFPGGVSVIRVKPDCKTADDAKITDLYDADGYAEHCISSLICSENGTIYYKNDSGCVFAIGMPTYENVIKLIDEIGTVSGKSQGKIKAAMDAYDALVKSDKARVSNYETLVQAEKTYQLVLKADEVETVIAKIGKVSLDSAQAINEARTAYNALSAEEKAFVENYDLLAKAEISYDKQVKSAVAAVEKLIDDIGTVTLQSASAIERARNAYAALPTNLQLMVSNHSEIAQAEAKLQKLVQQREDEKQKDKNKDDDQSSVPKTPLLQMQSDLENVSKSTTYQQAKQLLDQYYKLTETERLALADSVALGHLHDIVAKHNHTEQVTGVSVTGVDWNIRIVMQLVTDATIETEIRSKLIDNTLLKMWDIYLEDTLTGEKYIPQSAVQVKIPCDLIENISNYDKLSVIHYSRDNAMEMYNCQIVDKNIVFDTVDFSVYGVVGSNTLQTTPQPTAQPTQQPADTQPDTNVQDTTPWLLWLVTAAAGTVLLAVVIILRKRENSEQ
ncbi:MAG: PQQ-binding-like beta-propeller repeat protein [Oscillospiraceae bacterium]|nr:PQQ-binding-like beta-propeller repeat protein [Oscillospiraceae bacterium]